MFFSILNQQAIGEMEKELEELRAKHGKPVPDPIPIKNCKISPLEHRLIKLFQRGATRPKLRPIMKAPLYNTSLYEGSLAAVISYLVLTNRCKFLKYIFIGSGAI